MYRLKVSIIGLILSLHGLLAESRAFAAQRNKKAPIKVYFINPQSSQHDFWGRVDQLMHHAAAQLGIDIVRYEARYDRFLIQKYVEELVRTVQEDSYLVLRLPPTLSHSIINALKGSKLKLVTLERGYWSLTKDQAHQGRGKQSEWLGEMYVDDQEIAYDLARSLIEAHEAKHGVWRAGVMRKRYVIGLGGDSDGVALRRNEGLKKFFRDYPDRGYQLLQIVSTKWSEDYAYIQAKRLFERHPRVDILWAAADRIALGGHRAYKELPSSQAPLIVGGIDAMPRILSALETQEVQVSIGGHFMMGACAMIWIHDHFHGMDRFREQSHNEVMFKLDPLNTDDFAANLDTSSWDQLDFRPFSLVYNAKAEACPNLQTMPRLGRRLAKPSASRATRSSY